MLTVQELNNQFGNSEIRFYADPAGLIRAEINNPKGKAEIALHGAHLISFVPDGQEPVLWMSEKSWFEADKPIRGGIPVCWPWFGGHPEDSSMPSHGFARISEWEVFESGKCDNGATYIELALTPGLIDEKFKNGNFLAKYRVEVSDKLSASLIIENTDKNDLSFSAALHSYFNVSEISNIKVSGLDGRPFIDTLDDTNHVQQGDICFDAEIDRIYLDTEDVCVIDDPDMKRRIKVSKSGSRSTVVWNPWTDKAKRMPDFGDDEFHTMLCVETTNADKDARKLAFEETHTLQVVIESTTY
jgi:glucose-6-phosphate 1-epimerase